MQYEEMWYIYWHVGITELPEGLDSVIIREGRTIFEVMADGNADARLLNAGFAGSFDSSADISNHFW